MKSEDATDKIYYAVIQLKMREYPVLESIVMEQASEPYVSLDILHAGGFGGLEDGHERLP